MRWRTQVLLLVFVSLVLLTLLNWTVYHNYVNGLPRRPIAKAYNVLAYRMETSDDRAIVILTRTSQIGRNRLKNALASIQKFYTDKYKVIIFTDMDFTDEHREEIFKCSDLKLVFTKIDLFEYLSNGVSLQQAERWLLGKDRGITGRPLGYRLMCKFWAWGVFHHPLVRNLKYFMRLDDDSYFTEPVTQDPFEVMESKDLDYGYRAWFNDTSLIEELWNQTKAFLEDYPDERVDINGKYGILSGDEYEGRAVYNNFFVARTNVWRRPIVEAYLDYLIANHTFLKLKVGDANVHAFVLALAVPEEKTLWFTFAYNHNCHIHLRGNQRFKFHHNYTEWLQTLACREIAIHTVDNVTINVQL